MLLTCFEVVGVGSCMLPFLPHGGRAILDDRIAVGRPPSRHLL